MSEPLLNGVDLEIKEEQFDEPDQPDCLVPDEIRELADIDFETTPDLLYFDDIEAQTTQKCVDNCKIIIKDFETQLDWHLNNYMKLRNIIKPRGNASGEDLMTMESINEIIASRSLNKKKSVSNGSQRKKRGRQQDTEESDSEDVDDISFDEDDEDEEDDEDFDSDEDYDPESEKGPAKKKFKAEMKDEIEEEHHELVVPKFEPNSDEDDDDDDDEASTSLPPPTPAKKAPAKKAPAAKGKAAPKKTPAKRGRKKKADKAVKEEQEEEEKPTDEEFYELIQPKLILTKETFVSDPKKPMVMLDETNYQDFDFESDTKTNSFVIPFEDAEDLPYFIFENKEIIGKILSDDIKLVLNSVYEGNFNK